MCFGLTGERPYTLEEVGRAFNVTRERIRQIENHTLKKLEALPEAQRLREASHAARRGRPPSVSELLHFAGLFRPMAPVYCSPWNNDGHPNGRVISVSSRRC